MTVARNDFSQVEIVNLSRNHREGQPLQDHHGLLYLWTSNITKLGELTLVSGKTPQEAFDSSYRSGRDRGAIHVRRLWVFDRDTVAAHTDVLSRGFDKALHARINHFHGANPRRVPFSVDVNRRVESNEEALIGFDWQCPAHLRALDGLVRGFLDPLNRKTHEQALKAQIVPRGYQAPTLDLLNTTLQTHRRALLHAFPGWGKSTMGLYAIVRLAHETGSFRDDAPLNVLVTSPIVDTLEGFVESATACNYFDRLINVFTTDSIVATSPQALHARIQGATGAINLFVLSVQGIRFEDQNQDAEQVQEVTIRERYRFLHDIDLFAQISDERHREYGGVKTAEVFEGIQARYTLDLTATPYNLLQGGHYQEQEVVCDSMLRALREKSLGNPHYQAFPDMGIVSIGPELLVADCPQFGKVYSPDEDWDPRKLFDRDSSGSFMHSQALTALFGHMIGNASQMSVRKNPMTVSNDPGLSPAAKNVMLVVVPEGMNEHSAYDNVQALADLINDDAQFNFQYHAVTSYDLTRNRKIGPRQTVQDLCLEGNPGHGKRILIVTHRKMTTGSDVPPLGTIIMLDKMSNPGEFEQLLGRVFRISPGKERVRCYVFCPNMSLSHTVFNLAKDAAQHEPDPDVARREMFDCLPITLVGVERRVISYEEAYRGVLEETRRLMNGGHYTPSFFERFPEMHDALVGMEFQPLKTGSKGTQISSRNLARVSSRIAPDQPRDPQEERGQRKAWRETMTVLLNETPMVAWGEGVDTVGEAYRSETARALFGEANCELMLRALSSSEDFREAVNISLRELLADLQELSQDEVHDRLFRNEAYKSSQGLVYVPSELARQLVGHRNIRRAHKKSLTKGQKFRILVPNALSGSLPRVARELYPQAEIVCAEYFPYYLGLLRRQGFQVVDLEGDVENFRKMGKKKFDCVLGNPPYNEPQTDARSEAGTSNNTVLYQDFVRQALPFGKYHLYVTPASWVASGRNCFLTEVIDAGLKRVQFQPSETFPTVKVRSGFVVFHIEEGYRGKITVCTTEREVYQRARFVGDILNLPSASLKILNQLTTDTNLGSLIKIGSLEIPKGTKGRMNLLYQLPGFSEAPQAGMQRCLAYLGREGSGGKFLYVDQDSVKIGRPKVVIPRISDIGRIGPTMVVDGEVLVSNALFYIECSSIAEAQNCDWYLRSNLVRFLVKCYKNSNTVNVISNPFGKLPIIDFTRTWTNRELYDHFQLTQEERDHIEAAVK